MSTDSGRHHEDSIEKFLLEMTERHEYQCRPENLLCYSCCDSVPVCFLHNRYPKWCISLVCSAEECNRKWYACLRCENSVKMYRRGDLEKHNTEMHEQQQITSHDETTSSYDTGSSTIESELHGYFAGFVGWADFFIHHRKGNALQFLVAKQFLEKADPSCISPSDAELHVLIASLCSNLTKSEKAQFAEILRRISEKNKGDCNSVDFSFHCKIPETRLEVMHYVEGKNAILKNIPTPPIYNATNGDAYVRLPDVLRLYLSFGLQHSTVRYVNETGPVGREGVSLDIWKSPHAKKQLQSLLDRNSNSMKAALVKWSDGCDPNTSSKGNRGSVHVCTVTLISLNDNDSCYTFLMHMGRKDCNHYKVNKILIEDLKFLRVSKCYYDGNKFNIMQFLEFATIHDRPELSKECGYGYHGGTLTPRFPHSCPVTEDLPSCEECYDRRRRLITGWKSNKRCSQCHDWDFDDVEFAAPKDYPEGETIKSRQLTFTDMLSAATKSHNMIVSNEWTRSNALAYMQAWGINGNVSRDVVDNSEKLTPDPICDIVPPTWNEENSTEKYIAAVMHMVFLGVTKTIGMMMRELLSIYRGWPTFYRKVTTYLEVLKGYSLSYCRVWTFGSHEKPYSPWVSENHLAHARCFKMAYSFLSCILKDNDEEREEAVMLAQLAISSWVAVVARLMQKPSDRSNNNSAERHIKLFLSNINNLDTLIMEKKEDSNRAKKQKKRKIQTVTNLVGLLNLPNQMRNFGNLRDYWEGSYRGEGILRELKSYITQGTHQPWFAKCALRKYYQSKTMKMIVEGDFFDSEEDNDKDATSENTISYSNFYRYCTVEALTQNIAEGKPISGIMLNNDVVCCAVGRNKIIEFYEINFNDNNSKEYHATYYCSIQIGTTVTTEPGVEIDNSKQDIFNRICEYVVFLPHLDETLGVSQSDNEDCFHYYQVITSSWKERRCNDGVVSYNLPMVENVNY